MAYNALSNKLSVILAVSTLFAGPALAAPFVQTGDTVKVNDTTGRVSNGGAFAITGGSFSGASFETFCLETTEHLSLGSTYTVTLNTSAVGGGAGVVDKSGAGNNGVLGSYDPLSSKTAWLYSQYLAGGAGLTGWTTTGLTNGQRSGEVQKAIWYLEDEIALPTTGYAASLVNQALATTTSGLYGIRVMNLTASDGVHQDLLAPIPEPGTYAMMLAGLGLLGLMARRKQSL
jgi:hypothetical protein